MTNDRSKRHGDSGNVHKTHSGTQHTEQTLGPHVIAVERSGDWMPADELRKCALTALSEGKNVTLNLDKIDHLDASALQILLALDAELKKRGENLRLAKVSPHLHKWFEFAGADEHFFHERADAR